ncbi:unnamed protein product [Peniophora sp. CBMAI 1063]|nr:unnamed protein product [Peniophora sp. CBMAI 1063]
MDRDRLYSTISDIPRDNPLVSAYDAHVLAKLSSHPVNATFKSSLGETGRLVEEIDRTEEILELLLSDVRSRRNATASALTSLPPEIMSLIFEASAQVDAPSPPIDVEEMEAHLESLCLDVVGEGHRVWNDAVQPGSLGWVRLAHVCRNWRNIICGMSGLWSSILGRLPLGEEVILQRARGHCPVDISCVYSAFHPDESPIFDMVASPPDHLSYPLASQIRSLQLVDIYETIDWDAEWMPTAAWPNLEMLEISCSPYATSRSECLSANPIRAPKLRTILFQKCFMPWESASLNRLNITGTDHTTLPSQTLYDLLERSAGTLRYLELIDVTMTSILEDGLHAKDIILPHLQELCQQTDGGHCNSLLDHLKVPATTSLTLYLSMEVDRQFIASDMELAANSDIQAAFRCRGFDTSLDGLIVTQLINTQTDASNEFSLRAYCSSLNSIRSLRARASAGPFEGYPAPLILDVYNAKVTSATHNAYLDVCLQSISHAMDPTRFVTVSIDMPFWGYSTVLKAMSLYTSMRALHVVDPLRLVDDEWGDSSIPQLFPFLSALTRPNSRKSSAKSSTKSVGTGSSVPILDTLWLVQRRGTSNLSCSQWCKHIYDQLRHTLRECGWSKDTGAPKPIQFLRIDYLPAANPRNGQKAQEMFIRLADVVDWRAG